MRSERQLSEFKNTVQGNRSVIATSASELFDSTASGSATIDFYIPENAQVLSSHLRLKIEPWRSYSKNTAAGGSSSPTSGASSAASSAAGGATTSSTESAHRHTMFSWEANADGGSFRQFEAETASGGGSTVTAYIKTTGAAGLRTGASESPHSHTVGNHQHTIGHTHDVDIASHVHGQTLGIHLETAYPGAVSVDLNGTTVDSLIGGPLTASTSGDTFDGDLGDVLGSPGWHRLTVSTASGRGRIRIYLVNELLLL